MDYGDQTTTVRDEQGNKTRQKEDGCPHCGEPCDIDRMAPYYRWRRTFGHGAYMVDVDSIEMRVFREGRRLHPVALLELTLYVPDPEGRWPMPTQHYLDQIVSRYTRRDFQGKAIAYMGDKLETTIYIVLVHRDLTAFWAYDLSHGKGWKTFTPDEYREWLISK